MRPGAEFDPYAVLGLTEDATQEEIELAWRRALRATHPDCNPDDRGDERVKQVLRAGEILRDPIERARFDRAAARARRPRPEPARRGPPRRPIWTTLAWNGGLRADGERVRLPHGILIIHGRG